jgi:hypothetical protein
MRLVHSVGRKSIDIAIFSCSNRYFSIYPAFYVVARYPDATFMVYKLGSGGRRRLNRSSIMTDRPQLPRSFMLYVLEEGVARLWYAQLAGATRRKTRREGASRAQVCAKRIPHKRVPPSSPVRASRSGVSPSRIRGTSEQSNCHLARLHYL